MSSALIADRQALRAELRARRRSLTEEARALAEPAAQARIISQTRFASAPTVALYRAFDGELSTLQIESAALASGQRVVFPRLTADPVLQFVEPERWTQGTAPQPEGPVVHLTPADVLVVPGVAFDRTGHRLGFGRGWYDRTLAAVSAFPIGLAFGFQVVERLETAAWDRPVLALATESELMTFQPFGA